jgi:hypothetical protein
MYLIFGTYGTKCVAVNTYKFAHVKYTRNECNRFNSRFQYGGYNVIHFYRILQCYEMMHCALLVAVLFDVIITYICYLYVSWSL